MDEYYRKVPKRLSEYRKLLKKTQKQMGDILDVSQNHYSKLEDGHVILSYNSLMKLEKQVGGVYYLITGVRAEERILEPYFHKCRDEQGKESLLRLLIWVTGQGIHMSGEGIEIPYNVNKEIELLFNRESKESVWESLRRQENLTQVEMAEILDVNIKRYRKLEKDGRDPDAYILANLYSRLKYSPMIFIREDGVTLEGLDYIWGQFEKEVQEKLIKFVEAGITLL